MLTSLDTRIPVLHLCSLLEKRGKSHGQSHSEVFASALHLGFSGGGRLQCIRSFATCSLSEMLSWAVENQHWCPTSCKSLASLPMPLQLLHGDAQ